MEKIPFTEPVILWKGRFRWRDEWDCHWSSLYLPSLWVWASLDFILTFTTQKTMICIRLPRTLPQIHSHFLYSLRDNKSFLVIQVPLWSFLLPKENYLIFFIFFLIKKNYFILFIDRIPPCLLNLKRDVSRSSFCRSMTRSLGWANLVVCVEFKHDLSAISSGGWPPMFGTWLRHQ